MSRTEPYVSAPSDAIDLPYQGVGAELRLAREAAGQSADLVASTLRIRRPHIQAIEDGRFQDLPGQVYAIGFVRAYGEYLGLDADLLVARFREEADGPSATLELHFPEPAYRRPRLDVRALLVGLIIAVGAYGVWNYAQTRGQLPRELVASVPPNLLVAGAEEAVGVTPSTEPAEVAPPVEMDTPAGPLSSELRSTITALEARQATAAAPDQVDDSPIEEPPLPPLVDDSAGNAPRMVGPGNAWTSTDAPGADNAQRLPDDRVEIAAGNRAPVDTEEFVIPSEEAVSSIMVAAIAPDAEQAGEAILEDAPATFSALAGTPDVPTMTDAELPPLPTAPSADYEPRIYGQVNTDARVVVRARIESWVQIEGSNNELLLTRVLNAGDMFLVPNRSDLNLVTGNAGGIEILVDGVLMPPLGPEGTVRRNVRLTPDALTGADTVSSR